MFLTKVYAHQSIEDGQPQTDER